MPLHRRLVLAALALPAVARSQPGASWPERPIRVIAPDQPGSGNDVTARLFAPLLEAALGQPVVIENRPGAGGRIGVEAAFRAAPDGHTFLIGNAGSNGVNAALYRDLPYDLERDFVPVSLLVLGPNVLVINPKFPARTVAELIAHLKQHPGEVNFAITAPGASGHMITELFRVATGTEFVQVPYRGAPDMGRAVATGEAQVNFNNLVNIMPQVQSGEVLPIAVTTAEQSPLLPGVPTMVESGLPGFESAAWNGLFAPKGTPASIVARMQAELAKLRGNATLADRIRLLGGELIVSDGETLAARQREDIARWKALVERADIRLN